MDSLKIVPALETLQAEPSLHLDSPYVGKTQDAVNAAFGPLRPIGMPRIPVRLLNPVSAEYFNRTRTEQLGMTLPELEKSDKAINAWENAEPGLAALKALLHENGEGPYVMGETPSYADFIVVGFMHMCKKLGDDIFERMMAYDGSFPRLYKACEKWLKRDD